jgi:hypothetical protein
MSRRLSNPVLHSPLVLPEGLSSPFPLSDELGASLLFGVTDTGNLRPAALTEDRLLRVQDAALATALATLHADLATTIHADLDTTIKGQLTQLHTDIGTTLHSDLYDGRSAAEALNAIQLDTAAVASNTIACGLIQDVYSILNDVYDIGRHSLRVTQTA